MAKKTLAILLSAAMATSMLAACGGSDTKTDEGTADNTAAEDTATDDAADDKAEEDTS